MAGVEIREIRRSTTDRKVGGVAAGIAVAVGVDAVVIRLVFVVLTLSGGVGALLYAVAWAVIPERDGNDPEPVEPVGSRELEQAVGVGLVTLGVLLLLRKFGLFFPDQLVWPVVFVGAGLSIAWAQGERFGGDGIDVGRAVSARIAGGAVLMAIGIGTFLAIDSGVVVGGRVLLAVAVTTLGVALLAAPWIVRLGRQLGDERLERIRQEERAEMAAHLHDSVLQTLALIQRKADQPSETISLARRQERELRAWLFGTDGSSPRSLVTALQAVVDEIEADHPVLVDLVSVGDIPMSSDVAALVAAAREAVRNAANHSGAPQVSLYAEIADEVVSIYVRDRGRGFDPVDVDSRRRGIAESVIGRMRRHGGSAEVRSASGDGTEVTLTLPVRVPEENR